MTESKNLNKTFEHLREHLLQHNEQMFTYRQKTGLVGQDQRAINLGRFLRTARTNLSLSRSDFAEISGVGKSMIGALENGLILSRDVQREDLKRLAHALGEDMENFTLILGEEISKPFLNQILNKLFAISTTIARKSSDTEWKPVGGLILSTIILSILALPFLHWNDPDKLVNGLITIQGFIILIYVMSAGLFWIGAGQWAQEVMLLLDDTERKQAAIVRIMTERHFQKIMIVLVILLAIFSFTLLAVLIMSSLGWVFINLANIISNFNLFIAITFVILSGAYCIDFIRWQDIACIIFGEDRKEAMDICNRAILFTIVTLIAGIIALGITLLSSFFLVNITIISLLSIGLCICLISIGIRYARKKYWVPIELKRWSAYLKMLVNHVRVQTTSA